MLKLYENIKNKRLELGMTQSQLAEKLGYADKSMIAKIEKGLVDLPQSKIIAFSKALKTKPSELMGWDLDTKNDETGFFASAHGPLWDQCLEACDYNEAAAAVMYKNMKDEIEEEAMRESANSASLYEAAAGEARHTEWYSSEGYNISLHSDEVVVRVVGRSMEPTLLDGDVVVVCAQNVIDYPRQIALVKVNGDEATIKRVQIKDDGMLLTGDNFDEYPPHFYTEDEVRQLPVEIQGIVTKLIRDIK